MLRTEETPHMTIHSYSSNTSESGPGTTQPSSYPSTQYKVLATQRKAPCCYCRGSQVHNVPALDWPPVPNQGFVKGAKGKC
jgi:hypothetical protein